MTKIDILVNDDKNIQQNQGMTDETGICTHSSILDSNTNAETSNLPRCLLLEFLPRDLLVQSILEPFLDGKSLGNFWCATITKREVRLRRNSPRHIIKKMPLHSPWIMEDIQQIAHRHQALLTEEDNNEEESGESTVNVKDQNFYLRRQVFHAFQSAVDSLEPTNGSPKKKSDSSNDATSGDSCNDNEIDASEACCDYTNEDGGIPFRQFLWFSRKLFGNLAAIDYCKRVPQNLIWCGYLQFDHSRFGANNATVPIKVALVVHPRRWSMKEIRLWRNATTLCLPSINSGLPMDATVEKRATMRANSIPHNFFPVAPNRGRLVGLTRSARICLSIIANKLQRREHVARFSRNTVSGAGTSSTPKGGQFTVKMVSFPQAEQKLSTVFRRGNEPGGIPLHKEKEGMVLESLDIDGMNDDRNSLLCCWNHEFLWEDTKSYTVETSYALRDTMSEYDRLLNDE